MHSNSHPNGSTYSSTMRHVLIEGKWTVAHAYESMYETARECYRVIDIPRIDTRILVLRCAVVEPEDAKGYGWKRAIAAADEATTHDRNRNGYYGPITEVTA